MSQLVWLVTGCSSGLGEELVHQILARGDKVIATARRPETIRGLETFTAGPEPAATVLKLDITEDYAVHERAVAAAIAAYGRIDVLVNNAGFITQGACEDLSDDRILAQFNTNVFGTIRLTRAVLPHFRQRKAGTVVFVSSLSGWVGHPFVGAYASSKFAIEGFAESLLMEASPFGIRTLIVEPGRFRTKLLTPGNLALTASSIHDYEKVSATNIGHLAAEDMKQPGDPRKGISIVLDVVRGEGVAQGKETPFRLPLGVDCFDEVKAKCEGMLQLLNDWEKVIRSTDYSES